MTVDIRHLKMTAKASKESGEVSELTYRTGDIDLSQILKFSFIGLSD